MYHNLLLSGEWLSRVPKPLRFLLSFATNDIYDFRYFNSFNYSCLTIVEVLILSYFYSICKPDMTC